MGEHGLADEEGLDLREFTLPFVRVAPEEVLRDDQVENGIAKELQTLVGRDAVFFVCVNVGTVLQGEVKQVYAGKTILQLFLQTDQPMARLAPEQTGDASQDTDNALLVALVKLFDNQDGVVTAEPEGVADGDVDRRVTRLVRHVVEIAVGIRILVIDGGRNLVVINCQATRDRFDCPRRSE